MNRELSLPDLHLGLVSNTDQSSTVWFLAVLPQSCTPPNAVTIHFGLVGIGPVLVPLFFLRSSNGKDVLLLETSLNPYQGDLEGLKLLRCLCSQPFYQIECRDLATKKEYTLDVLNTHQAQYRQAVTLLETHPPWTPTEFVQAQHHLAQSWSTPEERFRNLGNPPRHQFTFSP